MDNQRSASERVRPILQAMERSIESARRSRVKQPAAPTTPAAATPAANGPTAAANAPIAKTNGEIPNDAQTRFPICAALTGIGQASDGPQRLKARPKRLASPFASPVAQPTFRSQVG
ncbi:MAG: hypothetical protein L0219_15440 [Phycisphaerales bacterium]|nr:hypothetical protein [Phycisphaerales bacterium]MCI0674350.1 hypothetical protein [Phycisphaerales bacterium]